MRWAEISIEVRCGAAEHAASIASDYAPQGVAVIDPSLIDEAKAAHGLSELELSGMQGGKAAVVRFYVSDNEAELAALLSELRARLSTELACTGNEAEVISISVRMTDDAEWSGWKQAFKPFRLAGRLIVTPDGKAADKSPDDIVITIEPGQAFGTGQHPTTAGCATLLEKAAKGGEKVLDIGTGTGILAIAAAKLGASGVLAVDIDPVAIKCASDNVAINAVADKVRVIKGDLLKGIGGQFDIIIANILAGPVIEITSHAAILLKEGGMLITSGYITKSEGEVLKAVMESGLQVQGRVQEHDWVAMASVKQGE